MSACRVEGVEVTKQGGTVFKWFICLGEKIFGVFNSYGVCGFFYFGGA
nr:hypothetical protein [Streptococcus dysgalactiae]